MYLDDDIYQCDICGEETSAAAMEPKLEGFLSGYYGSSRGTVTVHGHYRLCSYDYGLRLAEELAVIQLEEMAALGATISAEDREQYLADDVPSFDDFEYWEWVFEAVDDAERALPNGYVALADGDAGTWTLWALDREHFDAALARYAQEGS